MTQDIQTTIINNIRLGSFFVDGENRDGYVESSGDSIAYVYTNNISVYVPLTQLPDDAESLNESVLDTVKDQVKDSSLVGLIGQSLCKKQSMISIIAMSYGIKWQSSASPEMVFPILVVIECLPRNSKGFIRYSQENPCFHYSVKLTVKMRAKDV